MAAGPIRERQAEFEADGPVFTGTSSVRRPDAISLDYLTTFAQGPVELGDNSEGPVSYAWRVRNVGNAVYAAREISGGWRADVLLFTYVGVPILELDAAFEQAGRVFVCAERATGASGAKEIWIYYYNSLTGAFEFIMIDDGHTPRALLDSIGDSSASDILMFYKKDSVGVVYRQQRERYTVMRGTPLTNDEMLFPRTSQMNYGPVLFDTNGAGFTFTRPIKPIGNMSVIADAGQGDNGMLYNRSGGSTQGADISFSQPVNGIQISIVNSTGAGGGVTALLQGGGSVSGTFPAPTPTNPTPTVTILASNITRILVTGQGGVAAVRFILAGLKLSDTTMADVLANVTNSGFVSLTPSANPATATATVLGVTATVTATRNDAENLYGTQPRNILMYDDTMGPVLPYYGPGNKWYRLNSAAHFRTGVAPLSDYEKGIPGGTYTSPGVANNVLITFSQAVDGVEIDIVEPVYYNFGIVARNAAGAILAGATYGVDVNPLGTPYVRRGFYASGIKTLELIPQADMVGTQELATFMNLAFKKAGSDPATLPVPSEVIGNPPAIPAGEFFLEDVVATTDFRIRVVYSVRNAVTGRYTIGTFESATYPYAMLSEQMSVSGSIQSGVLSDAVIIAPTQTDDTALTLGGSIPVPPDLLDVIQIAPDQTDDSALTVGGEIPVAPDLFDVINILPDTTEDSMMAVSGEVRSGVLTPVVIVANDDTGDQFTVTGTIQGGTLVTV